MRLFIEILYVFIGTIFALWFYKKSIVKENKNIINKFKALIPNNKKQILFYSGMLVLCVGLSVWIELFFKNNTFLDQIKVLSLILLLCPIALNDYKHNKIPNFILIVGLSIRIIIYILEFLLSPDLLLETFISEITACLIVGVFFMVCMFVMKNSVGIGDIKLFMLMGLYQGLTGVFSSIFMSLLIIFFCSISMLIMKKKTKKDYLPFAPAILIGTYLSMMLTGM